MTVLVALLRGINVGGRNSLPMRDLQDILSSLGCDKVRTYIQSGNAVFSATAEPSALARQLSAAIEQRFGFAPQVLVMTAERLAAIAAANPFPHAAGEPSKLHVAFLTGAAADADLDALEAIRVPSERFSLTEDALYLHAPDGIGRSRLAAKMDRCLGVATTGRNWKTVAKLLELATEN